MIKRIKVAYTLYDSTIQVFIPIAYEIIEEGNRQVYKCVVELEGNEVPKWLVLLRFEIPKITQHNVTITSFSEIKGIGNSIDTAFFIATVEEAISVIEMIR